MNGFPNPPPAIGDLPAQPTQPPSLPTKDMLEDVLAAHIPVPTLIPFDANPEAAINKANRYLHFPHTDCLRVAGLQGLTTGECQAWFLRQWADINITTDTDGNPVIIPPTDPRWVNTSKLVHLRGSPGNPRDGFVDSTAVVRMKYETHEEGFYHWVYLEIARRAFIRKKICAGWDGAETRDRIGHVIALFTATDPSHAAVLTEFSIVEGVLESLLTAKGILYDSAYCPSRNGRDKSKRLTTITANVVHRHPGQAKALLESPAAYVKIASWQYSLTFQYVRNYVPSLGPGTVIQHDASVVESALLRRQAEDYQEAFNRHNPTRTSDTLYCDKPLPNIFRIVFSSIEFANELCTVAKPRFAGVYLLPRAVNEHGLRTGKESDKAAHSRPPRRGRIRRGQGGRI